MQNEADPNELSKEDRDALFPKHSIVPLPANLKGARNTGSQLETLTPRFPAGPPVKKKGDNMTL